MYNDDCMWKLTLLGAPTLSHEGRPIPLQRRKAWALLAYLALSRQKQTRETLATLFWPDDDERAGRADLSRILSTLRKALHPGLFLSDRESVILHEEAELWVDVGRFQELLEAGRAAGPDRESLIAAAALYQGDFMAGFTLPGCPAFDEWQLLQSESLRRDLAWALDELAGLEQARGALAEAIEHARRRVALDPLHEPAQRRLITLYAQNGQRAAAHRQYQACLRLLQEELGVEPHPETRQLYDQIRHARPPQPPPLPPGLRAAGGDGEAPTFVMREEELQRMQDHLETALQGDGQILFVAGGAGRGKTALLHAFARRALQNDPQRIVAAGSGKAFAGSGDPYLPFREILDQLAGGVEGQSAGGQMAFEQARRLWALLPETAQAILEHGPQLLGSLLPASSLLGRVTAAGLAHRSWAEALRAAAARPQPPGALQQAGLLGQFSAVLQALAHKRPLLLLLDDLQWSDAASIALLFHLGRRLHGSRILIVGAYRPDELPPTAGGQPHALAQLVAEFTRVYGDITIDLARSDQAAGRRFIDAYLDCEPNRLDEAFRDALYALTAGHPLFTVELLRELQSRGDLAQDGAGAWRAAQTLDWQALPARVEAVIARRLARLDPDALAILTVASVEGQPFTAEVVARVLGLDEGALLQTLSQQLGKQRRLLREQAEIEVGGRFLSRYRFTHALFQQYLLRELNAGRRRRLHGAVAAALSELYSGEPERIVVQLAHHYTAAGQWEQAAPHLVQAGRAARHKAALPEAVAHYEAALTHWPGDDGAGRAHALRKLGESLWMLGRHPEALERLQQAHDQFQAIQHRAGAGDAQRLLSRVYWEMGRPREAHQALQQALAILEGDTESEALAWALAGMGSYHMHLGDYDRAILLTERALAIARRLNAEALTVLCLCDLGAALTGKGDWSGLDLERESLQLALASNRAHDAARAALYLAEGLAYLGRYEEARQILQRALANARRLHMAYLGDGIARQLAELAWQTGRWQEALAYLFAADREAGAEPASGLRSVYRALLLGRIYNDLGLPQSAAALLGPALDGAKASLDPRLALLGEWVRAQEAQGQQAAALAAAREMLEWSDQAQYLYPNATMGLLAVCRQAAAARSAWQQLQRLDRQYGAPTTAAARLEGAGWLALSEQDAARAIAAFEQAAARWQALGQPYDRLRALSGLRRAHSVAGDPAAAQALAAAAQELAGTLAEQLEDATLKAAFLNAPLLRELHDASPME